MKKWIFSLVLLLALSSVSEAKDLGFRYQNGKCVDSKGAEGLNVGFLGQCSDLRGVVISNFPFDELDLSGSKFDGSDIHGSSIKNANLTGVSFAGTELSGADLDGSILHDVNFTNAVMVNTHLTNTDLVNGNFSGANLSNAKLSYMVFTNCMMAGVKLTGATMDNVDMKGADLSKAELTGANLQSATLNSATLDGAVMNRASLISASLKGVSAKDVSLKGAFLRQANMQGAKLTGAILRQVQGDGADLRKADLSMSDLRGAALKTAMLDGAVFTGAKISKKTTLPFDMNEAANRGMVMGAGGTLILWDRDTTSAEIMALKNFLVAQNIDVEFSKMGRATFDGTEDLSGFQYIVHIYDHSDNMTVAGQTALVNFVKDGGIYFGTGMLDHMTQFHTYLGSMLDLAFLPESNFTSGTLTIKAGANKDNDPLAAGLVGQTFTGTYSFANNMRVYGMSEPEAVLLDQNNRPIVAVRNLGAGKAINFARVLSGNQDYPGLTDPMVQRLILNAVNL